MTAQERSDALDSILDYLRNMIVVALGAIGTWWTATTTEEPILPWLIFIFGITIAYALFIPYKAASLIQGEWGEIAKVKALGLLFLGAPMYIAPAMAVIFVPDIAVSLATFQDLILRFQLISGLVAIWRTIVALIIGGIIGAVPMNWLFHITLARSGYNKTEIEETVRYRAGRSGIINLGYCLVVVLSIMNYSVGWADPIRSNEHFVDALALIFLLILYGSFFVTHIVPASRSWREKALESSLLLLIFLTTISRGMAIFGVIFSIPVMYMLYTNSKERQSSYDVATYAKMRKSIEKEDRISKNLKEMERSMIIYVFYWLYPRAELAITVLALICWMSVFFIFAGVFTTLFVFFLPVSIYIAIPYLWVLLLERTGKIDDIQKEIDEKTAKGQLSYLK